jgi:hypothetical protein
VITIINPGVYAVDIGELIMTTELFKAGDAVPREWFSRLENVASMTFEHPCIVETTPECRTIRKAAPILDIPMLVFTRTKDSDGERFIVEFDRETRIYTT